MRAASPTDGVQDGDETDTDCAADMKGCKAGNDCNWKIWTIGA